MMAFVRLSDDQDRALLLQIEDIESLRWADYPPLANSIVRLRSGVEHPVSQSVEAIIRLFDTDHIDRFGGARSQ
jgi:hypothetical protein